MQEAKEPRTGVAGSAGGTGPIDIPKSVSKAWWKQAHSDQLSLCRELEEIADSLPANVNRQKCIHAARALGPLMKTSHAYEETVLFPALAAMAGSDPELAETVERLKFEHFADECFAEELSERLMLLGAGDPGINMEATGYMLRGFFEGLRRHVAFEREHLIGRIRTWPDSGEASH